VEKKIEKKDKQSPQNPQTNSLLLNLGLNMAVGMAAFSLAGYYLDQKTGEKGYWTLGGMFLGLFYCGYEVWKLIRRNNGS